jgi:hypothetical protein
MGSKWILGRLAWGCGFDLTDSGQGLLTGCCECGYEPSGSCATELVSFNYLALETFCYDVNDVKRNKVTLMSCYPNMYVNNGLGFQTNYCGVSTSNAMYPLDGWTE